MAATKAATIEQKAMMSPNLDGDDHACQQRWLLSSFDSSDWTLAMRI